MVKLSRNYQNSKILAAQLQNKILIVGASGLLGGDLAIYLSSMYDVICTHNKNPMPNHKSVFLDLNNIFCSYCSGQFNNGFSCDFHNLHILTYFLRTVILLLL